MEERWSPAKTLGALLGLIGAISVVVIVSSIPFFFSFTDTARIFSGCLITVLFIGPAASVMVSAVPTLMSPRAWAAFFVGQSIAVLPLSLYYTLNKKRHAGFTFDLPAIVYWVVATLMSLLLMLFLYVVKAKRLNGYVDHEAGLDGDGVDAPAHDIASVPDLETSKSMKNLEEARSDPSGDSDTSGTVAGTRGPLVSWISFFYVFYQVVTRTVLVMRHAGINASPFATVWLLVVMVGVWYIERHRGVCGDPGYIFSYLEATVMALIFFSYILGVPGDGSGSGLGVYNQVARSLAMSVFAWFLQAYVHGMCTRMTQKPGDALGFKYGYFIYVMGDIFQALLLLKDNPSILNVLMLIMVQQFGSTVRSLGLPYYFAWKVQEVLGFASADTSPYVDRATVQELYLGEFMGNFSEILACLMIPCVFFVEWLCTKRGGRCFYGCAHTFEDVLYTVPIFWGVVVLRLFMIGVERKLLRIICGTEPKDMQGINDFCSRWVQDNFWFLFAFLVTVSPVLPLNAHLVTFGYV